MKTALTKDSNGMINKPLTVPGSSYLVLFPQYDAVCVKTTDRCWLVHEVGPRSNSHVTPVEEQRKPKLVSKTYLNWNKKLITDRKKEKTNKTHTEMKQEL